jgi:hypothetical protein
VISTSSTITRNGEPLARFAAQMATYSNTPSPAYDPNNDHHAKQEEDNVPVDARLVGVERLLRCGNPQTRTGA